MDAAAKRPDPIPVYAEMSSVNPVFVLPGAAAEEKWAGILAGSVLGSAGQLCTKPGLIFVPDSEDGRGLADAIAARVAASDPLTMLTEGMAHAIHVWEDEAVGDSPEPEARRLARPFAVRIDAKDLVGDYLEEHFGPTTVVVRADPADYVELADRLEGQLTATIIAAEAGAGSADEAGEAGQAARDAAFADREAARRLLPTLAAKAGRVVWNNVPTGVAVVEAMQHGGPWPATSAAWSTSVGTEAIRRFLRPVAMQGVPEDLVG